MVTATLKQIYPNPHYDTGKQPNIDIVFVHGLNPGDHVDHGRRTWTHPNGVYWPAMLLPKSIPTARVLTFEYNSAVFRGTSRARLQDHADSLLDQLRGKRLERNVSKRPIIFVCHSLGGLLVKQALVNTRTNYEQYGSIAKATYALMFFGTPHSGGNFVQFAKCMANIWSMHTGEPRNNMLAMLEKESTLTELMTEAFRYQKDKFKVVSFVESRPMKIRCAMWMPFASKLIVDRTCAILGNSTELVLDLNRDHSGLCKFAAEDDPAYEIVERHLQELAKKAVRPAKPQALKSPKPAKAEVFTPTPPVPTNNKTTTVKHSKHYPKIGTVTVVATTTLDPRSVPAIKFLSALGYPPEQAPPPAKKKKRSGSASSGCTSGAWTISEPGSPKSSPRIKQIEMAKSPSLSIVSSLPSEIRPRTLSKSRSARLTPRLQHWY